MRGKNDSERRGECGGAERRKEEEMKDRGGQVKRSQVWRKMSTNIQLTPLKMLYMPKGFCPHMAFLVFLQVATLKKKILQVRQVNATPGNTYPSTWLFLSVFLWVKPLVRLKSKSRNERTQLVQ